MMASLPSVDRPVSSGTTAIEGQQERRRPSWVDALAPYARPRLGRSVLDVATSVLPYLALCVLMYLALHVSYLLALALAIPASGFLVRTYIVFHDCTHGSFLPSKRANAWLGMSLGLLLFTTYASWRHNHAVHHATAGDLDRRGVGDVVTKSVAEYHALAWRPRLAYRLYRNPVVMFSVGPIFGMVLRSRLIPRSARPRIKRSMLATNVALVVFVGGLCLLVGWQAYLLVQVPTIMLAGATGIWLFYVQHQFEDAYWEPGAQWSYADAALRGSSYLKLPKVLQFFTGNIGLHHVHHLSARIPNYNLQRAHDENAIFHGVPTLSVRDGMRALRLKLWDEEGRRMVTFAQARERLA
jgi:omega-6 fatty acid desaturase (delta-12 desaturase)